MPSARTETIEYSVPMETAPDDAADGEAPAEQLPENAARLLDGRVVYLRRMNGADQLWASRFLTRNNYGIDDVGQAMYGQCMAVLMIANISKPTDPPGTAPAPHPRPNHEGQLFAFLQGLDLTDMAAIVETFGRLHGTPGRNDNPETFR